MPNSCKCILDRMVFKCAMTEEERDKILRNMSKNKPIVWSDEKGNITPIIDEEIVREEERKKFAEWIDGNFGVYDYYGNRYGFEELIEQYEKEQRND